MPVDPTKPSPSRRTQRKMTEEELKDIELKRIRGELSCAECRRLKLRCDKKVPCSSCVRRGCESICPCGILSAGQGTRFILADTEQLHRKISEMSHRIRQLEDALAILQVTISTERHPLLRDDLLKIKFGAEVLKSQPGSSDENEEQTKQSIDALGTLTLTDAGEGKYFGRSAGSETLMMAEEEELNESGDETEETPVPLPAEFSQLANLFPLTSKYRRNTNYLELLESLLPAHDRARSLSESWLSHASHFFRPIKREELLNSFIPLVYGAASTRAKARVATDSSSPPSDNFEDSAEIDATSPHALATLFFVFALGALLDLNLPPYNAEGEYYYNLGRAALSLRAVFDSPQVETVRAIGLMATYHTLGGKKYTRDSAWCIMSLASKLAQSIGLHRDSARWHMDPQTVEKRRLVFWEVSAADISHSLALGRPPAIHLSYVDCEFPLDEEATLSDTGEVENGFWRTKYTFARDMFMGVAEATLIAQSPSYSTVLNLDRKVRELAPPRSFKPYTTREDGEAEFFSSSLSTRDFYASQHRTVTMLYLHRSFFAQAMLDHPNNPLLSPFAPSFLTAYRCASVIIRASVHQFERCAEMAMRIWFLLYHTFSAAIIVGTVVTRSPHLTVAASALNELSLAVELFERTATQSQRAKIALGVLRKLQEKALLARSASGPPDPNGDRGVTSLLTSQRDDADDKLAIFGGQTRILKTKHKNSPSSVGTDSPSPPADPPTSPSIASASASIGAASMDFHPSLTEYLTTGLFPPLYTPPPSNLSSGSNSYGSASPALSTFSDMPLAPPISRVSTTSSIDSQIYSPYIGQPSVVRQTADRSGLWSQGNTGNQRGIFQNWDMQDQPTYTTTSMHPTTGPIYSQPSGSQITVQSYGTTSSTTGSLAPSSSYASVNNGQELVDGLNLPVGSSGALVEMGLSTESRMDYAWLSFVQDCGIMDPGKPA
ncbi:hypothetical protein BDN72DRAFT_844719 [Pluteus cervinus]|uniref:Uncharacterized protein n=1 Tax=Pluteus cervinus TaxID=181527 RepID=A0ACD3AKV3_9AGAR|nr:hypothetical protein BDN72DRAFT_844719 [Pluteus cervinus]